MKRFQVGDIVSIESAYIVGRIGDIAEIVKVTETGYRVHLYTSFGQKSERPVDSAVFRRGSNIIRRYDSVEEAFRHRRLSNELRRCVNTVSRELERVNVDDTKSVADIETELNEFFRKVGYKND